MSAPLTDFLLTRLVPVLAVVVGVSALGMRVGGEEPEKRFTCTLKKADDTIAIDGDNDKTTFTIASPGGIGQAEIARVGEKWPKAVVLKLKLKGLEQLTITTPKAVIGAGVSFREGAVVVRQWQGKAEEKELPAADPLRLSLRVRTAAGKPAKAIPLNDGHFEVDLPAALFAGEPKNVSVAWIDFFR